MLVYSLLLLIVAISLNYFNQTKLLQKAFWKRMALLLLILCLPLLVESFCLTLQASALLYLYNEGLLLTNSLTLISSLILVTGITLIISSSKYDLSPLFLGQEKDLNIEEERERLIFIFGAILGAIILNSAIDFLTILLGLELQSYSVYLIAASYRNYEPSEAGGLKYFLLGALSSTFVFMGLSLLYTYSGSTSLNASTLFYRVASQNYLSYAGAILIFTGISWKIAASPLHAWSIDVYDAVPTRSTAILSLLPKIALFSLIERIISLLVSYTNQPSLTDFSLLSKTIVFLIIALSLMVGSIFGLFQQRIKRLLAYSSVLNVGFILLGCFLTSSKQDSYNPLLYIIQYILTTAAIWLCLISLSYAKKIDKSEITLVAQLQGIHTSSNEVKISPLTVIAVCLTLLILSVAGIPPMVGFIAKYLAILLAVETGYVSLAIIAVLASIISTIYYLGVVKAIWTKSSLIPPFFNMLQNPGFILIENSLTIVFITLLLVLFNLQFQTVFAFLSVL